MGFVKLDTLVLLPGEEEVPDPLHVNWLGWLTGVLNFSVVQNHPWQRHVGPNWS